MTTARENLTPGIADVVASLAQQYRLTIVSSADSASINGILASHNLDQYFTDILGQDISPSKVEKMNKLLGKYYLKANRAVMITDTLNDLHDANEAGVPAIAVSWGSHNEATLREGNPAAIVNEPSEIIAQVKNLLN